MLQCAPQPQSKARSAMKKILIITDCTIGEFLIERAIETYSKDNIYYVIQTKERSYDKAGPDRFKFFTFDPTSQYKLGNVLKMDFIQVMLVMSSKNDALHTLKNIRVDKPSLRVILLDRWNLQLSDHYTLIIDINDQMSARLLDYLPNVPVIAQNVGLGEGEVMEVLVPFGSAYVYRHVGAIGQSQWRIAGIYRDQVLILPTERTMIHPNDLLLLIGEPDVLISIYRSIKRELGHFPAPFGTVIYIYFDMDIDRGGDVILVVRKTLLLGERLRRNIIIRITNPGEPDILSEIKALRSDQLQIEIDYESRGEEYLLTNDRRHFHVGLVVVTRRVFGSDRIRKVLHDLKVPVFKIAGGDMHNVSRAIVLLSESDAVERITTTVFDVASQLEWKIELLEYERDENALREQIEQYYENLSAIFSQSVAVRRSEENPIRMLKQQKQFVQCLPFYESLVNRPVFSFFSTDLQRLYFHLDDFHQLFIPVL